MKVDIFKSKFSEADFDPKNTETAIEKFQDEINGYAEDLEADGYNIIDTEFVFFDDGRAIAVMKYEEDY
ncbi:MAG: hypothetical protein SOY62_01460 [Streptococcus orisratti]|nr:hypothetical protein [Streptococcus orisratti]